MKYTVLLLRPDYQADEFGKDTYLAHAEAEDVTWAERYAQNEAMFADHPTASIGTLEMDGIYPADYAVLLVVEGHHNDIKVN